eukprot:843027-Rhodomonas_salina.1
MAQAPQPRCPTRSSRLAVCVPELTPPARRPCASGRNPGRANGGRKNLSASSRVHRELLPGYNCTVTNTGGTDEARDSTMTQ